MKLYCKIHNTELIDLPGHMWDNDKKFCDQYGCDFEYWQCLFCLNWNMDNVDVCNCEKPYINLVSPNEIFKG